MNTILGIMITVSLTDINNRFSQFLQYVKAGEKVRIVEEGQAVADIVLSDKDLPEKTVKEQFDRLVEAGKMIPAKNNKTLKMPKITEKERNIDWGKIYNETRMDRF
jgi:antitoxin (DNA-binding transcriptional repressor) of toxin-antitoxin stability system